MRREIRSGRGGLDGQGGGNDGGEAAKKKGTDWKDRCKEQRVEKERRLKSGHGEERKRVKWETVGPTGHQGPSLYSSTPSEAERVGQGVAHLLQVGEGDGLAGQHLVGLAGERRQRRQLLPMGQAAAQHSQTGAGGREGRVGTGSQATVVGPTRPGRLHPSDQSSR